MSFYSTCNNCNLRCPSSDPYCSHCGSKVLKNNSLSVCSPKGPEDAGTVFNGKFFQQVTEGLVNFPYNKVTRTYPDPTALIEEYVFFYQTILQGTLTLIYADIDHKIFLDAEMIRP